MYEDGFVGIKVFSDALNATSIKVIRKATGFGISDIKSRAAAGDFLLCCSDVDEEGIQNVIALYKALENIGAKACVFEDEKETTVDELTKTVSFYQELDAADNLGSDGDV